MPSDDYLRLNYDWAQQNDVRLKLAWKFVSENDELMDLLYKNLRSVQFNRYNLEVYYSIAELCRQNLLLLKGLEEIGNDLKAAEGAAAKLKYEEAIAALDQALSVAGRVRDERNQALQDTTAIWYKSWVSTSPRGERAPCVAHTPGLC